MLVFVCCGLYCWVGMFKCVCSMWLREFNCVRLCDVVCMRGYVPVSMYVCVYIYIHVCILVCVYVCMWGYVYNVCVCLYIIVSIRLRVTAFQTRSVRSELGNGRFELVPVVDPIHRRFEDWPMGWLGDLYRFMQWRTDGDSVSKPPSFHVSVCSCIIFFIYHCQYNIYVICIISCDCLRYFTSIIICITSWHISEYSSYLYSWSERLSASFHVIVIQRC